jgi:hypothetical protein
MVGVVGRMVRVGVSVRVSVCMMRLRKRVFRYRQYI